MKAWLITFLLASAVSLLCSAANAQMLPGCGVGVPRPTLGTVAATNGCSNGEPASAIIITLSNNTVVSSAGIGTTIGALAVVGGSGAYTFTLTSNPGGLFSISGSNLQVAAALSAGSDPITIQANNGAGSIVSQPFTIIVTGTCTGTIDLSKGCALSMLGGTL